MSEPLAENQYSPKHSHEPSIPPALDSEGRCLVCVLLVKMDDLERQLAAAQQENQRLTKALEEARRERNEFALFHDTMARYEGENVDLKRDIAAASQREAGLREALRRIATFDHAESCDLKPDVPVYECACYKESQWEIAEKALAEARPEVKK